MTLATSEVLDLAADAIQMAGWGTGPWAWDSDNGRGICIEGAIAAAAGVPMLGIAPNDRLLHECPAYMAVQDYLHMPEPLYLFNDLVAKEAGDVIAVLRGAAMVERVRESRAGYDTEDQPLPLDVA